MQDLSTFRFGAGAAQLEGDPRAFFYRSFAYLEALSPFIFLVLGAKGAGKSSIFRMLEEERETIASFSAGNRACFDEPTLQGLLHVMEPSQRTARTIWRMYFASILAKMVLESGTADKDIEKACQRFLARWGLVGEVPTDWQLRNLRGKLGLGNWVNAEFPLTTPLNPREADILIHTVDEWLGRKDRWYWILLDGLDEVGFNGFRDPAGESAHYSLMGVTSEILRTDRIRLKLFFRTDIYNSLSFVNKDHYSASKVILKWKVEDLAIIIANRLQGFYGTTNELKFPTAISLINDSFDWGASRVSGFAELCKALEDGNGLVLPRDLIIFCEHARKKQIEFQVQGIANVPVPRIISGAAIDVGVKQTGEDKVNDFLLVFPHLAGVVERMKGADSTVFNRRDLLKLLGENDETIGSQKIAELMPVGILRILDGHAVNFAQEFDVPPLYARALRMGSFGDE